MSKFKIGGFAKRISIRHYDTWLEACKTAGIKPSDILEVVDFEEDEDSSGDGSLKFKFIRGQWCSGNFKVANKDAAFKAGDTVTIIKGSRYEGISAINGVVGTIDHITSEFIHVKWPSGRENCYKSYDLEHIEVVLPVVFKEGGVVKRKANLMNSWWKDRCTDNFQRPTETFTISKMLEHGEMFNIEGFGTLEFKVSAFDLVTNETKTVDTPSTTIIEKKEDLKMSVATRRVVDVMLMDNDKGLDVSLSLVAVYKGIVTEDTDAVTVQEVMMNHNISAKLKSHNEQRGKQVDMHIRATHGTEVFLQPVKLKDLTWVVK